MGLSHLTGRTAVVEVSDGESFTVRGLDLTDIIALVEEHREPLTLLFAGIAGGDLLPVTDQSAVVAALFKAAPSAARKIIALGADEEDVSLVKLLPFPVQVDALEKIGALTFKSAEDVKKVMETIIRVLAGVTEAMTALQP